MSQPCAISQKPNEEDVLRFPEDNGSNANKFLSFSENQINLVLEISEDGELHLLHCSPLPFCEELIPNEKVSRKCFSLLEVHVSGCDQDDHHGRKHTGCNPGAAWYFKGYRDFRTHEGRRLEFIQQAGSLRATSCFQFYDSIKAFRAYSVLKNCGAVPIPLEYVSSFVLLGVDKEASSHWDETINFSFARNSWQMESQWETHPLRDLGISKFHSMDFGMGRVSIGNTGSMPAKEYLPLGVIEETSSGQTWAWQIEALGSWHMEISDLADHVYFQLSGPTDQESQWFKRLQPGESFESTPVGLAVLSGDKFDAFRELTRYRRAMRRKQPDTEELTIYFNDYMNCLMAEPSTEKCLPLIDHAAGLGVQCYVMDAGWYASGKWWAEVGEWRESPSRFPGGMNEVFESVKANGLRAGIWLELERMGVNCPLAKQWPEECFFRRHGKRVIDHNSYHLDFRHQLVRNHSTSTIERLIADYKIDFFKIDCNIDIGQGTEVDSDSFGDGLLGHQKAYHSWLMETMSLHPDIVIENCASGGLRNTYAYLDILPFGSTTDNQNYIANAIISINSAASIAPEQAGVWCYPLENPGDEELIMNMVSAFSWRPYLSGAILSMNEKQLNLVKEGISLYKQVLSNFVRNGLPFWPLGFAKYGSTDGAYAIVLGNEIILSLWNFTAVPRTISVQLPAKIFEAIPLFPAGSPVPVLYSGSALSADLPPKAARMWLIKSELKVNNKNKRR